MKRASRSALGLIVLAMGTSLSAKGITTRITIEGADLPMPIEVTDPAILESFNVWAGPGVVVNDVEETKGFIVDGSAGTVEEPPTVYPCYEVSFFVRHRNASDEHVAYVVTYSRRPSGALGYVHVPGRGDRWYGLNTRSIFRGVGIEGNWFRAINPWDRVVGPLIDRGSARTRPC